MILSGREIERHMGKEIVITPFHKEQLNPNSYNLTLSDDLMIYDHHELDMKKENTGHLIKIPEEGYLSVLTFYVETTKALQRAIYQTIGSHDNLIKL